MARSINKFSKEDIARIKRVCLKLDYSITEADFINWLGNFKEADWEKALLVSERIMYFSKSAIISELDLFLSKILSLHKGKLINIAFMGELGKSGSHLIYYIKKTSTFKNNSQSFKILSHLKKINQTVRNNGILLLIDDFIGTGESTVKFYNHQIKQQLDQHGLSINIIFLCVAFMENAIKQLNLNVENYQIFGTPYRKAFSYQGSPFGYRKKMLEIKDFCLNYGGNLFSILNKKNGVEYQYPLGYKDSQSLIIFYHSVPNNTLPILWSIKNEWSPLFFRATERELFKFRAFRQSNIYWFNVAYELKLINSPNLFQHLNFKDINFRLLALLRLKIKKITDPVVCQILGITLNELEGIYNDGILLNYFDEAFKITLSGQQHYYSILAQVKKHKKIKKDSLDLMEGKVYVPEKFLGRS